MLERVASALRSRLFRQGSWMMGGGIFKVGLAFLANLALVRLLTPRMFGEFAIVQAIVSLVGAFLNFRTGPLLLQASDEELHPHALSRYTGALIVETFLVGAISVTVLELFGYLRPRSLIFLLATLGTSWVNTKRSLYERNFEYRELSILESAAAASAHALTVAGAFAGLGALVLYLRNAIRQTIVTIGLQWLGAWQQLPVRWLTLDDWRHLLNRLRGFWTDGVLNRLFDRATVLLVGSIAGEQTTGYFFQARKLAFAPDKILGPVTNRVALSHFSQRVEEKNQYNELIKGLLIIGFPLLLAGILVFLLADPVIPWVFGKDWAPAVPILQVMTGVIVGMPLLSLVQAYAMSAGVMEKFVISGRGTQFLVLATSTAIIWVFSVDAGVGFGVSFSVSFLVSLLISVIFTKNKS